ncbi:MAG TPA: hypothetical protein VEL11_05995 [Candidatus Bathyarchaeia archaeon]|nr:hypothetical protein [Candidatus Bathyarchaeia archaeon]
MKKAEMTKISEDDDNISVHLVGYDPAIKNTELQASTTGFFLEILKRGVGSGLPSQPVACNE